MEQIAVIICVNNEQYYEECLFYLDRLNLPEGYTLEVYAIRGAGSIYEAYNQAMQQSDAKYKIYMHQDVFLVDPDLLMDMIAMFQENKKIGMLGLLGGTRVPADRRFFLSWDTGNVMVCSEKKAFCNALDRQAIRVFAVDGMFMMTQYDIPWREDVLDGWDFYDFSQSVEFARRGYEVWVIGQETPESIHDCGFLKLADYDNRQKKFLEVYREEFPSYKGDPEVYRREYREHFRVMMELKEQMKQLIFLGQTTQVEAALKQVWDERFCDTEFIILKNILEILEAERDADIEEHGFLDGCSCFADVYAKWLTVKFKLRREKYAPDEALPVPQISKVAAGIIRNRTMLPVGGKME